MMEPKVKKICIELGDKEIELSLEEIHELKKMLNKKFPDPWPLQPSYPHNDKWFWTFKTETSQNS